MVTGEKLDQMAILVSGYTHCTEGKLITTVPLPHSSGQAMCTALVDTANDWGLTDNIVAMVSDTISSNTGVIQGAATRVGTAW